MIGGRKSGAPHHTHYIQYKSAWACEGQQDSLGLKERNACVNVRLICNVRTYVSIAPDCAQRPLVKKFLTLLVRVFGRDKSFLPFPTESKSRL